MRGEIPTLGAVAPGHGVPVAADQPPAIPNHPRGNGDNAFGDPVSTERQVAALDCAIEQMGCGRYLADSVIREAAGYVAADRADAALRTLMVAVDLTGAYRLLAMLCTG